MSARTKPVEVDYFAVVDPADPHRMTYWRNGPRGLTPWPPHARYGPVLLKRDVPRLHGRERAEWIHAWFFEYRNTWTARVFAAIDADRDAAAARFAVWQTRCCCCCRELSDPASVTYGIGPDCRSELPASVLARLTEEVGRLHASRLLARP